jgi:hypothetical protein
VRHGLSKALTYYEPELRGALKPGRLPDPRQPRGRAQEVRQGQGPPQLPVLEALLDILARLQRTVSSASPEIQAHVERAERQYRSGQYQQVYHSLNAVWALEPSIDGLRADKLTAFSAWRLCEYHAKALGRAPDLHNPPPITNTSSGGSSSIATRA